MNTHILVCVEIPKETHNHRQTNEWTQWHCLSEDSKKIAKLGADISQPSANSWLIPVGSGVSFLADLLAICKSQNVSPKMFLISGTIEPCS
jgi:hypothetical protein